MSCFLRRRTSRVKKSRRRAATPFLMAGLLALMIAPGSRPAVAADLNQSGTVRIQQVRMSFMGTGNAGDGTLQFNGRTHPFRVVGLDVATHVQTVNVAGVVYNLTDLPDFTGAFVQVNRGFAEGAAAAGRLWLQNMHGVVLELRGEAPGQPPSLGGHAIYVDFNFN